MRCLGWCIAGIALLAAGLVGEATADSPAEETQVSARATLVPEVHFFAEPVVALVDVVVDRSRIDPSRVRLDSVFAPYERVGRTSVERRDIGEQTHLRYTTTLRCLQADCIPPTRAGQVTQTYETWGLPRYVQGQTGDDKRTYRFEPARVLYADHESGTRDLATVRWPPLRSLSRVNWSDPNMVAQGFPFKATLAPLPEVTYRVPPTLLGFALLGVAAALFSVPAVVAVRATRRRAPPEEPPPLELARLERALILVEAARAGPGDERRQALEALAVELESEGQRERTESARELAWSEQVPEPEAIERFAGLVRGVEHAQA